MNATKAKPTECVMVRHNDGYYERTDADIERWDDVSGMAEESECLERLTGWGAWTHAYRLEIDGCDYYYFAR